LLSSNYGKIRVNYIHGVLETTSENINRYITARGVEWTNKESVVVSLSETVIYSGLNRNIDIAYLNPISSHLELELNNRLNYPNNFNANAVWQLHFDYLFKNFSRLSINYLIDEFVLDPDIEIGKEHGKAYSLKYVFPFFNIRNENLRFYFSKIYVGTPTYRHGNGFNNFVQKDEPLGWANGSDGLENSIGVAYSKLNNIIVECSIGKNEIGQESIIYRPYEPYADYIKSKFPSGQVLHNIIIKNYVNLRLKNNFHLIYRGLFHIKNKDYLDINICFGLGFYY